jgi:hypothetical protein
LNYFFLSQGKKHSHSLALWAGLCQWHNGIAKSIFNKVIEKKKLKFAIDNIALFLKGEGKIEPTHFTCYFSFMHR